VNGDFEQVWKESVVVYFEILSQHLPGGTEKNNNKTPVRIICVPGWVRTGFSPRASQKHHLSCQLDFGGSSENADVNSGSLKISSRMIS
jgi:hypothetical protein